MIAKDSVKRRIESEEGISYTEFSYPLLQAYDFLVLHERFNCTLQMGGSDQWGNITAGMDLIRRLRGAKAHGLVMPLLMTAAGTKFGKTEAGAVWLDPNLTSPFRFYQFWLNTDDSDVGKYLRFFTFLDRPAIEQLEAARTAPESREAQRALAREVTAHGPRRANRSRAPSARRACSSAKTSRRCPPKTCCRCSTMCLRPPSPRTGWPAKACRSSSCWRRAG